MTSKRIAQHVLWIIAACTFTSSAFADREGVNLGIGTNRFMFGDDIDLDDSAGWRANIDYRFASPWGIELSYNKATADIISGPGEVDVTHTYLDLLYHFNSGGKVEPYIALGYGNADVDIVDGNTYDAGLGLKFYLSENTIIRPDIHYADVDEFGDDHMIASLNISWHLGGSSAPKKAPAKAAAVKVMDGDKDGVADSADACPNTQANVPVDARGCPLDSDGDGVYDYEDKCPGTSMKVKVDAQGCPVILKDDVSIELKVNFDSNSDVVKAEYLPEVRRVADFLEQYVNTAVVIEGHTDTSGAADYNKQLSQRRADAVARVLVEQFGVDATRVRSVGFGEENPVADESTPAGRVANRRVVAEISAQVEKPVER